MGVALRVLTEPLPQMLLLLLGLVLGLLLLLLLLLGLQGLRGPAAGWVEGGRRCLLLARNATTSFPRSGGAAGAQCQHDYISCEASITGKWGLQSHARAKAASLPHQRLGGVPGRQDERHRHGGGC